MATEILDDIVDVDATARVPTEGVADELVIEELLVEEISIDGMCGVYWIDSSVNLAAPYELDPQVSLRPEPFGALAYHFGTRRLSFLRSHDIVAVVDALASHPSVDAALDVCDIAAARRPSFAAALATLERSGMIRVRADQEAERVA